jgi:hypothetical protein
VLEDLMTGVLALAQGFTPEGFVTYMPYAGMFLGAILLLAAGLVVGRRIFGGKRSDGNVLDINAAARAHAQAGPAERKAA